MGLMLGSDGRTGILLSIEMDELAIVTRIPVSNKSCPGTGDAIYITVIFIPLNGAQ